MVTLNFPVLDLQSGVKPLPSGFRVFRVAISWKIAWLGKFVPLSKRPLLVFLFPQDGQRDRDNHNDYGYNYDD